jgi:hypothetical protein
MHKYLIIILIFFLCEPSVAQFIGDSLLLTEREEELIFEPINESENIISIAEENFTLLIPKVIIVDSIKARLSSNENSNTYKKMLLNTLEYLERSDNPIFRNIWAGSVEVDTKKYTKNIGYYELLIEKEDSLIAKVAMQEIVCMAFNNGAKVELRENQSVKHLLYRSTATTRLGEATCLTSSNPKNSFGGV